MRTLSLCLLLALLQFVSASRNGKKVPILKNTSAQQKVPELAPDPGPDSTRDENTSADEEMIEIMRNLTEDPDYYEKGRDRRHEDFQVIETKKGKKGKTGSHMDNSGFDISRTRSHSNSEISTQATARGSGRYNFYNSGRKSSMSDRSTPFDKFSPAPSPASNDRRTPHLYSPAAGYKQQQLSSDFSTNTIEEAWNQSECIPGINPRLFRLDSFGYIMMNSKNNRYTKLDFVKTGFGTLHSYNQIDYDTENPDQINLTLNLIQVAIFGYVDNSDEENKLTCWVPSQLHIDLWKGRPNGHAWFRNVYNGPSKSSGKLPHKMFDDLGIRLNTTVLKKFALKPKFEDIFTFDNNRKIPTCEEINLFGRREDKKIGK